MGRSKQFLTIFAMEFFLLFGLNVQAAGELQFKDVPADAWYCDNVQYVAEHGLMTGFTAESFGPMKSLTRGQALTILYRMAGEPAVTYKKLFKDVPDQLFFSKAVIWAAQEGITTGYPDKTFRPGAYVNREEFCTFLYRYRTRTARVPDLENMLSALPEGENVHTFAESSMNWAVANAIMKGKTDGFRVRLAPEDIISRAECATIIRRFDQMAPEDCTPIRIGTFNLYVSGASASAAERELEQFYSRGIDLLAVQELGSHWEALFRERLSQTPFRLLSADHSDYPASFSVGILYNASKYVPLKTKNYLLDEKAYDSYGNRRYLSAAEFRDQAGRVFAVISTHLEWCEFAVNAEMAQGVRNLADQYADQNIPVFICADFNNMFPGSMSQTIMAEGGRFEGINENTTYWRSDEQEFAPYDTRSDRKKLVQTNIDAYDAGSVEVSSVFGTKIYPLSWERVYGISPEATEKEKQAALLDAENDSVDNVFYSVSRPGFFEISADSIVNEPLYKGASDHDIVYGDFTITNQTPADFHFDGVKIPENFIER